MKLINSQYQLEIGDVFKKYRNGIFEKEIKVYFISVEFVITDEGLFNKKIYKWTNNNFRIWKLKRDFFAQEEYLLY